MTQVTKKFYADPGHGWLAVKMLELAKLGIAGDISRYSYQRGDTVYLEEDSDASKYIQAMKAQGIEVKIECKHSDKRSPIRSYADYNPEQGVRYTTYLQNSKIV